MALRRAAGKARAATRAAPTGRISDCGVGPMPHIGPHKKGGRMMKRTMRKWFYFDGSAAKTAEAWLNRLGAEGWRRGSLRTWTACFWQTGERVRCAVTTRRRGDEEFRALCRNAGWGLGSDGREASGGLHPAMPCDRIGADWKSFSQECELRWKTFSLSTPACVESAPAR